MPGNPSPRPASAGCSLTRLYPTLRADGHREGLFRSIQAELRSLISTSADGRRCIMLPSIASNPESSSALRSGPSICSPLPVDFSHRRGAQQGVGSDHREKDRKKKRGIVPMVHACSSRRAGAHASLRHRKPNGMWATVAMLRLKRTMSRRWTAPQSAGTEPQRTGAACGLAGVVGVIGAVHHRHLGEVEGAHAVEAGDVHGIGGSCRSVAGGACRSRSAVRRSAAPSRCGSGSWSERPRPRRNLIPPISAMVTTAPRMHP